jgi:hypothetical protein
VVTLSRLSVGRPLPGALPAFVPIDDGQRAVLRSNARRATPKAVLEEALDRYEASLAERLETVHPGDPDALGLRPVPGAEKIEGGTKPMFEMIDRDGRPYLLKAAPAFLVDAEILSYQIARALGRPAVPAIRCEIALDNSIKVSGVLRPKLHFDQHEQLAADTRKWTPLQREVMVRGHPLEWLLDNLDSHEGQYALIDGVGYPLNIDWDRSFEHLGTSRLSRYSRHRPWLPNLKNFLYADYVAGRVDLDFTGLLREAERIRDLPAEAILPKLEAYAEARDWTEARKKRFVKRMAQRKENIVEEFTAFVNRLQSEREARTGLVAGEGWSPLRLLVRRAKDRFAHVEQSIRLGPIGEGLREMKKNQAGFEEIERAAAAPKDALFRSRLPLPFDAVPIGVQDGLLSVDGDLLHTEDNEVIDVVLMPDGELLGATRASDEPPSHAWLAGGGAVAAAAELRSDQGKVVELADRQSDYPLSEAHFAQLLAEMAERKIPMDSARVVTNNSDE